MARAVVYREVAGAQRTWASSSAAVGLMYGQAGIVRLGDCHNGPSGRGFPSGQIEA